MCYRGPPRAAGVTGKRHAARAERGAPPVTQPRAVIRAGPAGLVLEPAGAGHAARAGWSAPRGLTPGADALLRRGEASAAARAPTLLAGICWGAVAGALSYLQAVDSKSRGIDQAPLRPVGRGAERQSFDFLGAATRAALSSLRTSQSAKL